MSNLRQWKKFVLRIEQPKLLAPTWNGSYLQVIFIPFETFIYEEYTIYSIWYTVYDNIISVILNSAYLMVSVSLEVLNFWYRNCSGFILKAK